VDLIGYSVTELPEEVRAHPGIRIQPVRTLPAALSALPGLPRYFLKAALQVSEGNQHRHRFLRSSDLCRIQTVPYVRFNGTVPYNLPGTYLTKILQDKFAL
jgi:hypothetical protein